VAEAEATEPADDALEGSGGAPTGEQGEGRAPAASVRRRRLLLAWVGSLVVVALAAAAVTAYVTRRAGYDGVVEAILVEDPAFEWPPEYSLGTRAWTDFHGLRPAAFAGVGVGVGVTDCVQIVVVRDVDGDSAPPIEFGTAGCGSASFPAVASMAVGPDSPTALRARFADGTSLQFRLEGDDVVVLSAPPPPGATP
jgi:hypothetical protein